MRVAAMILTALLAGLGGGLGVGAALFLDSAWALPAGLVLHLGGAFCSLLAGRLRRAGRLTPAERDAVLHLAILVPLFGPALAWTLPRREGGENVLGAHEVLEQYAGHVKPKAPEYERTLFTGDRNADLARELDIQSFVQVLRTGGIDQKRSALCRLAELGGRRYIGMIRRCLTDDEQEVCLYAYGELDRLTRTHEVGIASARRVVEAAPECADARNALARAHLELGTSGILDGPTERFHIRAAIRNAVFAKDLRPGDVEAILLEARAHAGLDDLPEAERCLAEIPEGEDEDVAVSLVRAELAFRKRDFSTARVIAGRLLLAEADLPDFLKALCMAGRRIGEPEVWA